MLLRFPTNQALLKIVNTKLPVDDLNGGSDTFFLTDVFSQDFCVSLISMVGQSVPKYGVESTPGETASRWSSRANSEVVDPACPECLVSRERGSGAGNASSHRGSGCSRSAMMQDVAHSGE